jgi:hypothetical protein
MNIEVMHDLQGVTSVLILLCTYMYHRYESRGKTIVTRTTERRQVSYGQWEETEDVKVHTDLDPLDAKKKKYWGFGLISIFAIACYLIVACPK